MNYATKFGFITDLKDCLGKTIELVEKLPMEFGCTNNTAYAIRFTDKSRAFILGKASTHCYPNPTINAIMNSKIFTPDEYAQIMKDEKIRRDTKEKEKLERKRQELERLKKELGDSEV